MKQPNASESVDLKHLIVAPNFDGDVRIAGAVKSEHRKAIVYISCESEVGKDNE
jgi:hypothetical protein